MSFRSGSPTPSASSSGSPPPPGGDDDGAARLAQLEALLGASLGYDNYDEPPLENEPPKKKRKHASPPSDDEAPPVAAAVAESGPTEIAFRLFSTQKTPQTVVIEEEDINEVVEDRRIRDVADEPKAVVKQRAKDIQSVVVTGETIRAQSSSQPLSRFPNRLTLRLSTTPATTRLPPLAYLNALLHPSVPPTTRPSPRSKRSQRKARTPQTTRHSFPPAGKVKLKVVPTVGAAASAAEAKSAGRKRLSKSRRVVKRRKDAKEMVRKAMEAVEPGTQVPAGQSL